MREMELDQSQTNFDRMELDTLELVKSIGADSLGRAVENKQSKAIELAQSKQPCRIHGKKN
jgi:hypothetical protein